MLEKLINIGANSLKRQNMTVMAGKVITRLKERTIGSGANDSALATQWAAGKAESLERFVTDLNAPLWEETQKTCVELKQSAEAKLAALGKDLGGGGHYPLLYFLTRHLKPQAVVETGVAAGWSSRAILTALKNNANEGTLYSSDFPYFRYKNPEKYVGFVVDEDLKQNWNLFIDGDQNNLPKIIDALDKPVALFHYDSDKSAQGRNFAYDLVAPKLTDNAIVIFDDIQDNLHFKNFVAENNAPYKIFEFEGKYIGLTGPYFNHKTK